MAQNIVQESSVQEQAKGDYWGTTIFRMAAQYDIIPKWWSPSRDAWFRQYWYQENFLASAIYAIANRNAAFGWELTGLEDDVEYAQQLLQFANFGDGWQQFIIKFTIDYLTQDAGAAVEVIRKARVKLNGKTLPAIKEYNEKAEAEWFAWDGNKRIKIKDVSSIYDSPLDPVIGIANLDIGQIRRTGNRDVPAIYTDRDGKQHAMKWWQILLFNEMPSPIEKMNNIGYSALTRVFRASHIMQSISLYHDEKVSGRFNRAIHLTNVDADVINDAIAGANQAADNRGLIRYSQPIVAATLKEDAPISLETINLAEIPDGFNFNDLQNWYIAGLALALGVDFGFLAPLPGKGLGTASQSETMMRQARGKSSRLFMDMISNALNFKGVLPKAVQFEFIERDTEEEETDEKLKKTRAERHKIYLETGITTPTVSQQMLSDAGDIPEVYLEQMGQEDTTPVHTIEGDTDAQTIEAIEDGVSEFDEEEEKHHHAIEVSEKAKRLTKEFLTNLPYEQIKEKRQTLFKKQTLLEKIKNVARKAFKKKQVEVIETGDEELDTALELYGDELEELTEQANNGEITQPEFEKRMAELVTLALTAFYSQAVGLEPEDFTEQDDLNLDGYIDVNLDSVEKISTDIYDGRYQPTEDEPDRPLMIITRLALWTMNAYALATVGNVFNPENQEKRYKFILGNTQEHCEDCLRLNGQVHTASEWSDNSQWLPRSHSLACSGFNCLCFLVETDEPINGNF